MDVRGITFIGTTDLAIGSAGSFVEIEQGAATGNTFTQIRAFSNGGTATNNLILQNSGSRVGIGITNPLSKLHVGGTISDVISIGSTDYSGGAGQALAGIKAGEIDGGYGGNIEFQTLHWGSIPYDLTTKMIITGNKGYVGIGTLTPDQLLTVNGTIHAKQVNIDLNIPAPDYVFEKDYDLKPLAELDSYILQNKHLPEIPSAVNLEKNGINVSELSMKLLQKVEELTLYLIEKDKEIKKQQQEIEQLKSLIINHR